MPRSVMPSRLRVLASPSSLLCVCVRARLQSRGLLFTVTRGIESGPALLLDSALLSTSHTSDSSAAARPGTRGAARHRRPRPRTSHDGVPTPGRLPSLAGRHSPSPSPAGDAMESPARQLLSRSAPSSPSSSPLPVLSASGGSGKAASQRAAALRRLGGSGGRSDGRPQGTIAATLAQSSVRRRCCRRDVAPLCLLCHCVPAHTAQCWTWRRWRVALSRRHFHHHRYHQHLMFVRLARVCVCCLWVAYSPCEQLLRV
jgi:hypothetical protein